eukprot:TRINITY_DN12983_c0_g1_i1.p1 TRINITY_DN12983_c0_g1~~TRINITY_DN12983_c0_g1_i1.p1  ORF type:complete len:136 (-),score=47.17 TRINITY_DN12983_c0_g1_i1:275-682(-)
MYMIWCTTSMRKVCWCDSVFFFFKQKTAYEMLRSLVGSEMCIRDRVSKEDFLKLMATQVAAAKQDTEEDVRDAFRVFEKTPDTFISASELRHILTDLGEQITDEQADELLKDADIDGDGQINYEELIHKLMGDYL